MPSVSASVSVNGYRPAAGDQDAETAFYRGLLQVRDAVLSDKHARFKIPAPVRKKLQSTDVSTPSASLDALPQLPGLTNHTSTTAQRNSASAHINEKPDLTNGARNAQSFAQNREIAPPAVALPSLKPQTPSGIDPIFLTKSDDLIRAETQLQRQRIERCLLDMVNQRMHGQRNRDEEQSAYLMDVSQTLQKAHELVKPVSGLQPPAHTHDAASDSFDENSYYSSQANDWSSESVHSRAGEAVAADTRPSNLQADGLIAIKQPSNLASSALLSQSHPSKIERLDKQTLPPSQSNDPSSFEHEPTFYTTDNEGVYDGGREDSEEYSPPAAEAFSGADADADVMDLDDDSSEFVPEEPDVSLARVPVITNHLTHIAAPQPARVSPLAVAKVPGLGQSSAPADYVTRYGRVVSAPQAPPIAEVRPAFRQTSDEDTTSPRQSAHPSPAGPAKKSKRTNKKKRKREAEAATKARKHREKRMVASPEPYIKPEPASPLSIHRLSDLQPARSRPHSQLPPDVELVSRQDFRPRRDSRQGARARYRRPELPPPPPPPPPRQYGYTNDHTPAVPRIASPASYQHPRRDNQDLRRVASLHAAQRPASPQAQMYSPVAPYRTISQPYADRQTSGPRYAEQATRAPTVQYMPSERSMSPSQALVVRDAFGQGMRTPTTMAPPPLPVKKIIIDQYGNKYYANEPEQGPPVPASRMSTAPQPRPELDSPFARAPSRATSVFRTPHPLQAGYEEEDDMSRMSRPLVRRVTGGEAPEYRSYRQRDYSRPPEPAYYREDPVPVYAREVMLPPALPTYRAPVYPADAAGAAAYIPRAYSVRPEVEPTRYLSRHPSVAPHVEYAQPPPPPVRAISAMPGSEYGARPTEIRYEYDAQPPPPPIRAVSVMPGSDYGRQPTEFRYDYAQAEQQYGPRPSAYMEEGVTRASAAPSVRQVCVDQYGRELRHVSEYR
ncbi:hypothetical protein MBLNU459_g8010t2 [Dothideomycetes sp. NU459]